MTGRRSDAGMAEGSILALLPFRVKGALSLRVLREMRARGLDVCVAFTATPGTVTLDPAQDFEDDGKLLDLSAVGDDERRARLEREIAERRVALVLQIGATPLYRHLPYLKERNPGLRILDTLYNEVGHVLDHFLYERAMDGVVVESEHMRRFVAASTAIAEPRIFVVESGVDLEQFAPPERRPPRATIEVGYLGRLSPEKNPLGFVDLCEALDGSSPALRFHVFGDGPLDEDVRRRVKASRAPIEFHGRAADLVQTLRRLDALVVPSLIDGRPNTIMEANACGVPVIGAPVGGIPEMIMDGTNGYVVPPGDARTVAGILARWTADPTALEALRESSRRHAERYFDQRRMMDRYEEVFRQHLAPRA
jgi:glycosyltransferase involved in cell wall biosynthesis